MFWNACLKSGGAFLSGNPDDHDGYLVQTFMGDWEAMCLRIGLQAPATVKANLLPYAGVIVTDGHVAFMPVMMGPSMKKLSRRAAARQKQRAVSIEPSGPENHGCSYEEKALSPTALPLAAETYFGASPLPSSIRSFCHAARTAVSALLLCCGLTGMRLERLEKCMSTYTVIDAAQLLKEALAQSWDENRRYRERLKKAQDEYAERVAQANREWEERNRAAREEFEQAMKDLEKRRLNALSSEPNSVEQYSVRLAGIQKTCRQILQTVPELGNAWLAKAASYHDDPQLCTQIVTARENIRQDARRILEQAGMVGAQDIALCFENVEREAASLKKRFEDLIALLKECETTAGEMDARQAAYSRLLQELTDGTREALEYIRVLPPDRRDDDGAAERMEALHIVEHYLYGGDSLFLGQKQKEELRALYGVHGSLESDLQNLTQADIRTVTQMNRQFRAAKKRSFDTAIAENRSLLDDLWENYLSMYEKLHGSLEGAMEMSGCPEEMLETLKRETAAMRAEYLERVRQDMLQEIVEHSLMKSRGGMQVRRVADDQTASGNLRMLYEIGESGTCVEIYTDARGQILIEAGGITEGSAVTEEQKKTIARNNRYFCDHELPAILDSLHTEMQSAGADFAVRLKREPEEDRVHTFNLSQYDHSEKDASIIAGDGTLMRQTAAAETVHRRAVDPERGTADA